MEGAEGRSGVHAPARLSFLTAGLGTAVPGTNDKPSADGEVAVCCQSPAGVLAPVMLL